MGRWLTTRWLAGIGALAYFVGVAIENQEILTAPTLDSGVEEIRANYADHAFSVITGAAGALAQVAFVLFAVALVVWLRERRDPGEPWPTLALAGGIASPVIAAAGLAAGAPLLADPAAVGDDVVTTLFQLDLLAQFVAAPFLALFLAGVGISALRTGSLPGWLAWFGLATAVPLLLLGPVATFQHASGLEFVMKLAFAANAVWVLAMGLWLLLGEGPGGLALLRRATFLLVAISAGATGIALLAAPDGTAQFFAWFLGPRPLAALAGGLYVGAAVTYAEAIAAPAREVRGLVLGAAVLSVSVLIVSLAHTDQFDFDRLQAILWFALFVVFSLVSIALFILDPVSTPRRRSPLAPWARAILGAVAVAGALLALWLWIHPAGVSTPLPIELGPLGGGFIGCWVALLATVCGWAAYRNRADEAGLPTLLLVCLAAGALIAALRTIDDLLPSGEAAAYVVVLGLLVVAGIALLDSVWPKPKAVPARGRSKKRR
jgi:hypothetical protein